MPLFLDITVTPPGEAPVWVREKWVGLSLPLAQADPSPMRVRGSGVLSGPKGFLKRLFVFLTGGFEWHTGYLVEQRLAVAALATHSPDALAWWQQNVPSVTQPNRYFVFSTEVGHVRDIPAVA